MPIALFVEIWYNIRKVCVLGKGRRMDTKEAVALARCTRYDADLIYEKLADMLRRLDVNGALFAGKKIFVKPNLVMAKKPEAGATTHPAVLTALVKLLMDWGAAEVIVGDSPGGPLNGANLAMVYRTCGLMELGNIPGVRLNDDFGFRTEEVPGAKVARSVSFMTAALEADMLINVCKLKTHGLTGMSCAVKNLYGLIPGVEKFAMHATFPKIEDFSQMLVDISAYFTARKPYLAICDGITGMEGNGPTHGTPVEAGVLLASRSPWHLDLVAAHIIGCTAPVVHLEKAADRGFCPADWREVQVLSEDAVPMCHFKQSEAASSRFLKNLSGIWGGKLAEAFAVRPIIDKKRCVGCGVCERSCPAHTIGITETGKGRCAVIRYDRCIKCYCCQELCPHGAVKMGKNPFIRWIH